MFFFLFSRTDKLILYIIKLYQGGSNMSEDKNFLYYCLLLV